jgi:hypothetical protein
MSCQAQIQQGERKGEFCGKPTEGKYCKKHIRQEIIDKAIEENIRYCDIARSCFTILEDYQTKCEQCHHRARIRDRKNYGKKRQDNSLCLDCSRTLTNEICATGKHDKKLRRCIPCYNKLLEVESKRTSRERNYKVESFKNKHVIWNHYVKGSKKRGIDFKLTKELFNSLIIQKCFYCNYIKDGEVNGIDRIDNNKGYLKENVVACCESCNIAKGSQHPQEFIDKLYSINIYNKELIKISNDIVDKWKETYLSKSNPKFSIYMKSANTRNIEFKLSENEFNNIIINSCYLCGLETSDINKNGIDRINNNKGYILENCKTCCGHCNLLKKDLLYKKLLEISERVYLRYNILYDYFKGINIPIRESKIEGRNKVLNPDIGEIIEREYKSVNEIIIPSSIPEEIKNIIQKDNNANIVLKQWKVKQIYEAIQENKENTYKQFCEENNDMTKLPDWNTDWVSFVLCVKGKTLKDSEITIRNFVENLRRIRHNELCTTKSNVVERKDRQQWPASTILKAFLDNKIEVFKKFTEEQTGDNPEDPQWQKRWNLFITSLEENKQNKQNLNKLCSKFMTAQRTKRYRQKHNQ